MHFFDLDKSEIKELSLGECQKTRKLRHLKLRWEDCLTKTAEDVFNVIKSFFDGMHLYSFHLFITLSRTQYDLFVSMMYDYLKTRSSIHHFCLNYKCYTNRKLERHFKQNMYMTCNVRYFCAFLCRSNTYKHFSLSKDVFFVMVKLIYASRYDMKIWRKFRQHVLNSQIKNNF